MGRVGCVPQGLERSRRFRDATCFLALCFRRVGIEFGDAMDIRSYYRRVLKMVHIG